MGAIYESESEARHEAAREEWEASQPVGDVTFQPGEDNDIHTLQIMLNDARWDLVLGICGEDVIEEELVIGNRSLSIHEAYSLLGEIIDKGITLRFDEDGALEDGSTFHGHTVEAV